MSKKITSNQSDSGGKRKKKVATAVGSKKKTSGVKLDTFYLSFIGEYVELAGEFTIQDMRAIANINGYLLDADDEFLYLGQTAGEVTVGIKRQAVYSIQVIPQYDAAREMLENLSVPEDETGHN